MTTSYFSADILQALVDRAALSPRRRQHWNLHDSHQDPCQRLFNAVGMDSYIRPHRHSLDPRTETLVAVRGLLATIVFDDSGAIREVIKIGSEKYAETPGLCFGVELPAGTWHTVVALLPGAVLLECKAGPFNPNAAKELAPWSPEEDSLASAEYLNSLRECALR